IAVDPGSGLVYVADYGSDKVSVISGTSVTATVSVQTAPVGVGYDSANGDIYVAANGADMVSIINGTHWIHDTPVGKGPMYVAYNSVSQLVYVTDSNAANVTALSFQTVSATFHVGAGPFGVAFDCANGFNYVANNGGDTVSVINKTTVVDTISVGAGPVGLAYDPGNGGVYVTDSTAATLTLISTLLGESAALTIDHGHLVSSTDANQSLSFVAFVWAMGSGGLTASYKVEPSPGFGCVGGIVFNLTNEQVRLSVACIPPKPGIYTIWLNVSDSLGNLAWAIVNLPVDPALFVPAPTILAVYLSGRPTADVGQAVGITAVPSGGSGVYNTYFWAGVPAANCSGIATSHLSCRYPNPGAFSIFVEVNDSNQGTVTSPASFLTVYSDPLAPTPSANRTSADIGQSVRFSELASGGPGSFLSYTWTVTGQSSCTTSFTLHIDCSFGLPGPHNVSVRVTDADSGVAVSSALRFVVFALPTIATPTANRSVADVGQTIGFAATASGAAGNLTFTWTGLPAHCVGSDTSAPRCTLTDSGQFAAWPTVIDGNGGTGTAPGPATFTVYAAPQVGIPTVSPSPVTVGSTLRLNVSVFGGSGNLSYAWTGLPPGCPTTGRIVDCSPSLTGSYSIRVTVTDRSGAVATSQSIVLSVQRSSVPFGLTLPEFVAVLAVPIVAVVVVLVVVLRRRAASRAGTPTSEAEGEVELPPTNDASASDLPHEQSDAASEEFEA
ncbi:MAG: PKD domain-containing protein, partial [Thermoplasmata archaeon]|nr:PKD domain-containing protein [Thermoplasmata archaeon]